MDGSSIVRSRLRVSLCRAAVLLCIPRHVFRPLYPASSPREFPKLVRPPRKVLTRSILRRDGRRRKTGERRDCPGNAGRRSVDSEPRIVPRIPSHSPLAGCEVLEAAATLLETSISRAALYVARPASCSPFADFLIRVRSATRRYLLLFYRVGGVFVA